MNRVCPELVTNNLFICIALLLREARVNRILLLISLPDSNSMKTDWNETFRFDEEELQSELAQPAVESFDPVKRK